MPVAPYLKDFQVSLPLDSPQSPELEVACLLGVLTPLEAVNLEALRELARRSPVPVPVPLLLQTAARRVHLLYFDPGTPAH
jgi:hypothetical protein